MPVAPYCCRFIIFRFHLDEECNFSMLRKKMFCLCFCYSLRLDITINTPNVFYYFFQLRVPALKYNMFSVEGKCALQTEQAMQDMPYLSTTSFFQWKDWNGLKDTVTCSSLLKALCFCLPGTKNKNPESWMLAFHVRSYMEKCLFVPRRCDIHLSFVMI